MSKRESINQEPLTIEELKTMAGLPVWCPSVEICDETRVGEAIATAIGLITVLAMIAMVPIIVIGGAIMLIWSIFAG